MVCYFSFVIFVVIRYQANNFIGSDSTIAKFVVESCVLEIRMASPSKLFCWISQPFSSRFCGEYNWILLTSDEIYFSRSLISLHCACTRSFLAENFAFWRASALVKSYLMTNMQREITNCAIWISNKVKTFREWKEL